MQALRTRIAMNLRERFREHEDDEEENNKHQKREHEKKEDKHDAKKNETKHEGKKNETRHNGNKNENQHDAKKNENHRMNKTKKVGEKNETHPEGPIIGQNEDEHYVTNHTGNLTQNQRNHTLFLQATPQPGLVEKEAEGLSSVYVISLSVLGVIIVALASFFIKRTCIKKRNIDDFHNEGLNRQANHIA